ncbi:MAG: serine protease [Kiritimatiellae bacterium]|nr:serine protease [Kiritimatiellia bacterium]
MRRTTLLPALWLVICARVPAGTLETVARRVLAEHAAAIVPVTAVLKIEVPGEESPPQEQTIETYGTVLSTNGLTVVSSTSLNPIGGLGAMELPVGGRVQSVTPRGTVSQIRVRLPDGDEVTMRQVLTDDDLDLAFLAPDTAANTSTPPFPQGVDFASGAEAEVMDEIIGLGRAGKLFNWTPAVGTCRIIARVEKPRRLYLFSAGFVGGVGTPTFTADGRPLGLVVMRRQRAAGAGRGFAMNQAAVIVPAAEVALLARRAEETAIRPKSDR